MSISTHTPLAGRDYNVDTGGLKDVAFLLTRPLRGATVSGNLQQRDLIISTHTPLAGRDAEGEKYETAYDNFYSHAPCGARHGAFDMP